MLDQKEALAIIFEKLPNGQLKKVVEYKNLYLLQVFTDDPSEEEYDPFFSIDKTTGEFKEFSVLTDGDTAEIVSLFTETGTT